MPTTIDNLLSRMTLEEKIGQMILASIEVSRMDAGTREFLRKNHIGNVILFGKNCAGRAALAQLNAEILLLSPSTRRAAVLPACAAKPRFFPAPWSLPARAIPPTPTKLGV